MSRASKPSSSLGPELPARFAARIILDRHFSRFRKRLRLAACLDVEAVKPVHRLRVGCRRIAAAMKVFKKYLDPKRRKRLSRTLKEVRRAAGNARDLDVMMIRQAELETPDPELMAHLKRERILAQVPIQECYQRLERDIQFERDLHNVVPLAKGASTTFRELAQHRLGKAAQQFFTNIVYESDDLEELHQFRIRIKRLRYTLEIVEKGLPQKNLDKIESSVVRLQEMLGEIQDAAVACGRILDQPLDETMKQERLQNEQEVLRAAREKFETWWTPKRCRKLEQRIDRLVAD